MTNTKKPEGVKKIINWGELSRICSGSRSVILKNEKYWPKKHLGFITDLLEAIKSVMEKHGIDPEN